MRKIDLNIDDWEGLREELETYVIPSLVHIGETDRMWTTWPHEEKYLLKVSHGHGEYVLVGSFIGEFLHISDGYNVIVYERRTPAGK
jgi:hypothetical protein